MKKLYILSAYLSILFLSKGAFSQCTCSGGATPDSVVYNQYFDSLIATNTTISFPKFDPAIGVLTCFRLSDTVTTVVDYNLQNNQPDTEIYKFRTSRLSEFTGPNGFDSYANSPNKTYGPYQLLPYHSPGNADQVDIGPDTVFNKDYATQYGTSDPAYYGTGTVDFNYLTTSTFTILTGSSNAIITLRAYTRLDVQLVYYWCPFSALATHLAEFTTLLQGNRVLIKWKVNDVAYGNKYEIELSSDGRNFTNLGKGASSLSGNVSNFKFIYTPKQNFAGNLYFRIKQTDESGKILYSEIHSLVINNAKQANYSVYPNPAINGINIQFVKANGGEYEVELFNSIGQSTFKKIYSLSQSGSVNIEWHHKPAPGIYYLKVRDLRNRTEQVEKLQIL